MSQRKSDLSKEIQACTTTYSAAFINSLPPSCERIFTDKSMLQMMEQFSIGEVIKPSNSSFTAIQLPVYELTLVTYYELDQNVQKTEEIIGKLSVLGLTSLYSRDLLREETVVGGFLTILSAHCSPQQLDKPAIKENFESIGFDMQPQKISLHQLDQYFFQELNAFVTYSALQPYHRDFYKFAITIGLSTLLFLGKSASPESIDDYLDSKWQVLASRVGCEKLIARKPNDRHCNVIRMFFSTCGRTAFFELYRSLSKQQNHKFKTAFEFIVESLKWADMGYIHLIDKYIVKTNPELLSMYHSLFGGEKDRMKHVYKLMELLPQADHPYLKLLLPYNRLTVITRENFKFLHGAARAVASIDDRSISYIYREDTDHVKDVKNQIKNYVLKKKTRR